MLQQQESSGFNPLSREYQLECTVKQLMQERNEMHNSLLQTRQQLDNAIKLKNSQAEEIIKLQKKIDTIELNKISFDSNTKGDSVEIQKKPPQRLKDGVSTKLLKMIMQGTLQDQKQFQDILAQKQSKQEPMQEKQIQQQMSFRKYISQTASNKEINRSLMISVQSLVHAPQFQKKLENAKDKIQRYSNNINHNQNRQAQHQTNFTNNLSMTLERPPLEEFQESYYPD
ncbi:unnamed protein product [Paramecium sonneborni]|uniref:Uncharacterized protein n=1 Tax=Paramecium sonneborni TaxID=65129 RepID=A0A8S1MTP6_9CILI|nr:unnamed protein product [Paramecium sonneborni]